MTPPVLTIPACHGILEAGGVVRAVIPENGKLAAPAEPLRATFPGRGHRRRTCTAQTSVRALPQLRSANLRSRQANAMIQDI